MTSDDPLERRWRQRFAEYAAAVALLRSAAAERAARPFSIIEEAGYVQFFELTIELSWKALAPYLMAQGVTLAIVTPLATFRAAFEAGVIDDGDDWTAALRDRNQMSHAYDAGYFTKLVGRIDSVYLPVFEQLAARLAKEV